MKTNPLQLKARGGYTIFRKILAEYGIFFITLGLIIICSFLHENFLSSRNLLNIARQISVIGLLTFAEAILLISGQIDLSVGAAMAVSGVLAIDIYTATNSIILGTVGGIIIGIVISAVNGLVVSRLSIPAFIATLAMQMAARGAVLIYTGGIIKSNIGEFRTIGQGYFGQIPIPVIILLVSAVLMWILLEKTTIGRKLFACGGNVDAARASGINVKNTILFSYIVAGALTGLAGALQMARLNSSLPTAGEGFEGTAIASAIIGGIAFAGGEGNIWGALIGALIMGILSNILNLMSVNSYMQDILNGLIIVAAVALDLRSKKGKR